MRKTSVTERRSLAVLFEDVAFPWKKSLKFVLLAGYSILKDRKIFCFQASIIT